MIALGRLRSTTATFIAALALSADPVVVGADARPHVARIVSLAPALTEDVFAVGAGDLLVGVDAYSNRPDAAKKIERVGRFTQVNVERIVALHPDVVLGVSSQGPQLLDLARAGIATKTIDVDSLADDFRAIGTIGKLVGHRAEADVTVRTIQKRLDDDKRRAAGYPELRAAVIFETSPIYLAGGPSYIGELLRIAHIANVAGAMHEAWPVYSAETLLSQQPDVIIVPSELVLPAGSPWDELTAVRKARVMRIDGDLLARPGPQVADLVDTLIDGVARLRPDR